MKNDRNDKIAAVKETMLQQALEKNGDNMPPEIRAQFLSELLSVEGEQESARKRAEAERRARPKENGR